MSIVPEQQRLTREEFKKQKELDAARKAGTAPAEVDEDGNEINPHIPQYISQAPWYLGSTGPTLKHQRNLKEQQEYDKHWYARGQFTAPAATKYRKGACENCGAMTHKSKDCVDRPRVKGAKYTGTGIRPDEVVMDVNLDFEGKRDRWNGYDPDMYKRVVDQFERTEAERRKKKAQDVDKKLMNPDGTVAQAEDEDSDREDDRDQETHENDQAGMIGYVDTKRRVSVRNLRIREDTAKYLLNLDVNSAHYDPKSRSMREAPNPNDPNSTYTGENFTRLTGDVSKFNQQQLFAWEAYERGQAVDPLAAPSQAFLLYNQFKVKKGQLQDDQRKSILDRYGGQEHLENPEKELLTAQTEHYVEYARDGRVIKGQEKAKARSKYEEDVYPSNHTSVWGSYWEAGQWGYACCGQLVKAAYCTGSDGRKAKKDTSGGATTGEAAQASFEASREAEAARYAALKASRQAAKPKSASGSSSGSESDDSDKKKKKKKGKGKGKKRTHSDSEEERETARRKKAKLDAIFGSNQNEQDRGYNSRTADEEITEEDMEAYRLARIRSDDPMANMPRDEDD